MSQTIPEKTRIEHDEIRNAKRVVLVDPSDNGVLGSSGYPLSTESAKLKTIVDETVSGTTYIGKAQIGTLSSSEDWTIQKLIESSGTTTATWATGSWDNRASLTYS